MMALMLCNSIYLFDVCWITLLLRRVRERFVFAKSKRWEDQKLLGLWGAMVPRKFCVKILDLTFASCAINDQRG
jgi:hypothetical protein